MKHNVILITIDSLRADRLGCLGYHRETTPNLDKLASKGYLFLEAISVGSNTRVSFPALFASLYPFILLHLPDKGYMHLPREWLTVTEILHNHGYNTLAVNSNPLLTYYREYGRGFDICDDPLYEREKGGFFGQMQSSIHSFTKKIAGKPALPYPSPDAISKKALAFLDGIKAPFFLWVNHMSIHIPYFPPKKFVEEITGGQIPHSRIKRLNKKIMSKQPGVSKQDISDIVDLYDAEVRNVDHCIGDFIEQLDGIGISNKNTYFIITSDHGDELMEHGGLAHADAKLYEELIRVPLIIVGPNLKATRIERQVSTLHLTPAILGLNDIAKPDYYMGYSSALLVQDEAVESDEYVISESCEKSKSPDEPQATDMQMSCRSHQWKYIYNEKQGEELYDLQSDPQEKSNIAEKEPNRVRALKKKIIAHQAFEEDTARKIMEIRRIKRKLSNVRMK